MRKLLLFLFISVWCNSTFAIEEIRQWDGLLGKIEEEERSLSSEIPFHSNCWEDYNKSACGNCPDFESCHSQKGVCWKYIIQGYGGENVYYPDPRCPKAPALKNRIY